MTDRIEQPDDEFDPSIGDDYLKSERVYKDALTTEEGLLVQAFYYCDDLIESGKEGEISGQLKQIEGAHGIWSKELWKYVQSRVTGQVFHSQMQWLDECVTSHKVHVFGQSMFFEMMQAVEASISSGVDYQTALRVGLNWTAVKGAREAGALSITRVTGTKSYVASVTPLGKAKLLADGLKSQKQLFEDLGSMSQREASATVMQAVGRASVYVSKILPYAATTPFFDEAQAHVFAVEAVDSSPNNGDSPYNVKVVFEADTPPNVVKALLSKWSKNFQNGA